MRTNATPLRRGDWVEVRSPAEILATLDDLGAKDAIPFMPEMLHSCGRTFRVARKATKTCVDTLPWLIREFRVNDVFLLENLRCHGGGHDGCQRRCTIFWKSDWLRKVEGDGPPSPVAPEEIERLRARLKTKISPTRYLCQSTQMMNATRPLPKTKKALKCLTDVINGNYTLLEMVRLVLAPSLVRLSQLLGGYPDPVGNLSRTPSEGAHLQTGEIVEVKSPGEIGQTLDTTGKNRGLVFGFPMASHCGGRYRVLNRLDRMIVETTGEMRTLTNTVLLEGATCQCKLVIGGCPRAGMDY